MFETDGDHFEVYAALDEAYWCNIDKDVSNRSFCMRRLILVKCLAADCSSRVHRPLCRTRRYNERHQSYMQVCEKSKESEVPPYSHQDVSVKISHHKYQSPNNKPHTASEPTKYKSTSWERLRPQKIKIVTWLLHISCITGKGDTLHPLDFPPRRE